MNIPTIRITAQGNFNDINMGVSEKIADDLLNYIKHKISNEFMGSIMNSATISAIQMFIDRELSKLVYGAQIIKDHTNTWIIKDHTGLWV